MAILKSNNTCITVQWAAEETVVHLLAVWISCLYNLHLFFLAEETTSVENF